MLTQAKLSPLVRPGHVKHLGFAGGDGHLTYRFFSWWPIPAELVDVEKAG